MKKILLAMLILGSLLNTGCKKCQDDDMVKCRLNGNYAGNMQVIKDCTGIYLRYQQKDYQVCNKELLANYKNTEWITTSFNRISDCMIPPESICNMWHQNEGYIEITCIQ